MNNIIPQGYLAAGSLTFERDTGGVLWRLSWGGAAYTGPTNGETTNDVDGNFGPPVPSSLPSCGAYAWLFKNAANAKSVTNMADYRLTSEQVVPFFNNAGQSFTVTALPVVNRATDANASEQPLSDTQVAVHRTSTPRPSLKVPYDLPGDEWRGLHHAVGSTTISKLGTNPVTITAINDNTPEATRQSSLKIKTDRPTRSARRHRPR
jgi:hypothetical protein